MAPISSITVKLRVVGIQYHENVVITVDDPTIEDLMKAARDSGSPRKFQFTTAPDGTLHSASAILPVEQVSISSGKIYHPGLYSLDDDVDIDGKTSVKTWQWYLIRRDNPSDANEIGRQVNQPDMKTEAFTLPRNEKLPPPQYRFLQDGDEVIWRLVVVAAKPIVKAGQSAFMSKVEKLPNFVPDPGNEPVKRG
jgi:hypothetical protein